MQIELRNLKQMAMCGVKLEPTFANFLVDRRLTVYVTSLEPARRKFTLELWLPEKYPLAPPRVLFRRGSHPTIDEKGRMRFDEWSPGMMLTALLGNIQVTLSEPLLQKKKPVKKATNKRTNRFI
jgi:ubiquitin-protein ligase